MKRFSPNQQGFIPLLITVLLIVATGVALVYLRVLKTQQ